MRTCRYKWNIFLNQKGLLLELIGTFHLSSKEIYMYSYACDFSQITLLQYLNPKNSETVVQAYLPHVYATLVGSLTIITDNRKELRNELFEKVASELGIK